MTDGGAALQATFGAPDACVARLLCDVHPAAEPSGAHPPVAEPPARDGAGWSA